MATVVYTLYTLEGAIKEFFDQHPSTDQASCDAYAKAITGTGMEPMPVQGCSSYTVSAQSDNPVIVQFRALKDRLNSDIYDKVKVAYGDLIPSYTYHGRFSDDLEVNVFTKLSGISAIEYFLLSENSTNEQKEIWYTHLAEGLALFFARSWNNADYSQVHPLSNALEQTVEKLDKVATALPERYNRIIGNIKEILPQIYDGSWPIVPTHADLNITNMIANPMTGDLNGIIDWAGATLEPFGLCLYAVGEALGRTNESGWHDRPGRENIDQAFWKKFEELTGVDDAGIREKMVRVGHLGILLKHGYGWDRVNEVAVVDPNFRYQDGLLSKYL